MSLGAMRHDAFADDTSIAVPRSTYFVVVMLEPMTSSQPSNPQGGNPVTNSPLYFGTW